MSTRLQLSIIVTHIVVASLLWWLPWVPIVLAFGWAFAWLSYQEPTPTRNPRQRDVAAFEKTPLGRALKYRTGWMPSAFPRWGGPVLVLLLFGPGVALALAHTSGDYDTVVWWRRLAAWTLTSPVLVLSLGVVVSGLLIQPIIMPFFVLGYVAGLVGAATQGIGTFFLVVGAALPPLLLVYATDLARLLRRRLESRASRRDVQTPGTSI